MMCGSSGEGPSAYWETYPKARKEHTCCECLSVIAKGEKYQLFEGVWDGEFSRYRTCLICADVRDTVQSEREPDEGIQFGCLWEETGVEYE